MNTRKFLYQLSTLNVLIGIIFNLIGCVGILPHTTDQRASEPVEQYGNGYRYEKNGWIYLHIQGEPYVRGYQHGYLVASELPEILRSLKYLTLQDTGMEWEFFVEEAEKQFAQTIDQEFLDEIKGIADGAKASGTDISW